ncbi:possible dehydratase, MaoC family protein [Salipiger bermudensis HTCC2601]|uniref:Possible dehydratase, MaoC family protein n=1 Tax=Salipiger bermudensis (strain DSM 26914 / JCM 13377 / KCTC 12554 / HTCC2601) TaxID=314265 RepID=Q0FW75_SALBH|nr:possible dehydratase, MaoC family protein [Salipiger bermudensis HTCC2601]
MISKRESKSRPNAGLVEFETRGLNQRDEVVVILRRTGMMIKKSSLEEDS